jgi:pimeloyl-ACP methyl ester carboxylesterase
VVLVGHSYGGSVISVASTNAPNVKALVYVEAFAPEAGESIQEELASAPPPPAGSMIAVPFTTPTSGGAELYVNAKHFGAVFASAESPEIAARLASTQRPFAARCLTDKAPAAIGWKTIPSWYVIGEADKVIPPDIQMKFATRAKSKVYHVPGGDHPSMIAHPEVTVAAIEDAANTVAH